MTGGILRVLVAAALLPWQLVPAALGQEHRHLPDHEHDTAVVHRHFQSHGHPDDATHHELASDDDHVQWMSSAALGQADYHARLPATFVAPTFLIPPAVDHQPGVVEVLVAPAHGPPRTPSSLRGPPRLTHLR